jgi:hypothetical protein
MFLRYARRLKNLDCRVSVDLQPPLLNLFSAQPPALGIDHIFTSWRGYDHPTPPHDVQIEVMELPYALRDNPIAIPHDNPYLFFDPEPFSNIPKLLASPESMNIGLVCSASAWDPSRSIPPPMLEPLASMPALRFFNLEYRHQDYLPPGNCPWIEGGLPIDSVDNLAAAIVSLDLVITVDTLTAHLAGALGKAVWVLLLHGADWRWGQAQTTPWYPTMRLFRQKSPGDWRGPIREMTEMLPTFSRAERSWPEYSYRH